MLTCLALSHNALALSSDRDQPANIEADDTEFNFKTGVRTFVGNVIVIQGTLRIKADKVIANYKDGTLQNATAWGKPARFKQRPDGKPNDVEGNAKKIFINSVANTLTLNGSSSLKQGADTIRGETIIYNMANDTLRVKGGSRSDDRSRIDYGGKEGKASSGRKLEDPFKDDPLPATPTKQATPVENSSTETKTQTQTVVDEPPVPVGRSRLIIQPKPKKQEDSDETKEEE